MSIHVITRFQVKDFDVWKQNFDADFEMRKANGELSAQVFQDIREPNHLVLLTVWESLDVAEAFIANPNVRERIKEGGLIGEQELMLLRQVE